MNTIGIVISIILISIIGGLGVTIFLGYISGELDCYKKLRKSESEQETLKICQDWMKNSWGMWNMPQECEDTFSKLLKDKLENK